jgi:hypothetical protein
MWNTLLNALFGCSHRKTTFPLTPRRKLACTGGPAETYVVCLNCGTEFAYDWQTMRIRKPVNMRVATKIQEVPVPTPLVRDQSPVMFQRG